MSELKANFKKNLKFCKKAVLYNSAPDQFGNYDAVFAAKEQADLEALVEEISGTVNQRNIKQLTGGFWLGEVLPNMPEASDTCDILEVEFAPEDIADCGGMANPVLARLAMLAASYLAECEIDHKAVKEPLPTYDECTPNEFLYIFDELHEMLAYPPDRDVGLMVAADMMQVCKGAPFENSVIPSMCGTANKGHPRREEILGLYKQLVHSIVEQKTSLAEGLQSQIEQMSKYEYRLARYTRKVTGNTFKLPKEIAKDICLNLDVLQYLELRGNCIIMRTKTKEEEQEDYYHEADNAVLVEAPKECTTIVEIPSEMAEKAGIKNRVEIYSLKDRIEIYAIE
ncbi:hypothetical protein GF343_05125 [Candidatus Woesearchaeota archaeon]|nr:hypothetical protein [Candidatus Woesearchaeota archaeon]